MAKEKVCDFELRLELNGPKNTVKNIVKIKTKGIIKINPIKNIAKSWTKKHGVLEFIKIKIDKIKANPKLIIQSC